MTVRQISTAYGPVLASGPGDWSRVPYTTRVDAVSLLGEALLALGMLLTTASQLRLGNLPIGPGELCLVIWLMLMFTRELGRLGPPMTPALSRLLIFWTVFVCSQSLGFLTALFLGEQYDPHWVLHDVMAYPLLIAVSCLSIVDPGAESRLRRVAWFLTTFGTVSLAFQVAVGWDLVSFPLIEPWFWERFSGWSSNPNQLSLLCGVLGLISLHLADTATRTGGRLVAILCLILPIYVGRMTGSDTFTLALVASGPIFILLKLRTWLLLPGRKIAIRSGLAWVIILSLPLMVALLSPLALVTASNTGTYAKELAKNGGQDLGEESNLRFSLWVEAIKLGIRSGFMGLGPGPHLEIPVTILMGRAADTDPQPYNLEHPDQLPVPNFEAHNSFLDLLTQGGVIAVLCFVWIVGVSGRIAYKARLAGLTTLICGLVIFCMTGLIVRHPLVWFAITLCLVAKGEGDETVAARS